jgi:hypothetical protein
MHVFTDLTNRAMIISSFGEILKLTGTSAVISLVVGVLLAAIRVSPVPVRDPPPAPAGRAGWGGGSAPSARSIGELVELTQRLGWTVCVNATPQAASWVPAGRRHPLVLA